ncbi:MAG: low specificity L-threonine aldolase [Oscillospiraceae bacterium]|nr:low specificity L-threonine aldolase [Oscillospiraceae bacterium]
MLSFLSDYTEGAHPKLLEHLAARNLVSLPGYGLDEDTDEAKRKICAACGRDDLQIQFLTGGTQTNLIAIAALLKSYEGVVSADTGHVNSHEAGAIEYSGHKVLSLPHTEGKLLAETLKTYMDAFLGDENNEHMVRPGMVYISQPTEFGTLYSLAELTALSETCHAYGLPLYIDGARLGYGLMSPACDMSLRDIVELSDLFYIGGTKVGALCGEALIFTKRNMPAHFLAVVKQQGALLAKMRVVSQQFDALFTDGLYWNIGREAVALAMELKAAFVEKGYALYMDSPTNQQFFVLTREQIDRLREQVAFGIWEWLDPDRAAVRFVTSWATTREAVDALKALL